MVLRIGNWALGRGGRSAGIPSTPEHVIQISGSIQAWNMALLIGLNS